MTNNETDRAAAARRDEGALPADAAPGATLAGEERIHGSVLKRPTDVEAGVHDVTGYFTGTVRVDPAVAGTVAGDTEAAETFLTWDEDEARVDKREAQQDEGYGPDGSTIQEVGGMAREG